MSEYSDSEFIKSVLEHRYVTQSDVDHCLKIQANMPKPAGIGEILREQNYLDDQQLAVITTLLKYKTEPIKSKTKLQGPGKPKDKQFAEIALRSRLITAAQLIECVDLQKKLEVEGDSRSLAYVMMRKGYLTENDVAFIEEGGTPVTVHYTLEESRKFLENLPVHLALKQEEKDAMPTLTVIQGPDLGKIYPLNREEVTIGRVRGADIRLSDAYISRIHCKVVYDEESNVWEVVDMMSTHGVYVNAQKIQQKYILRVGDQIRIGETALVLSI